MKITIDFDEKNTKNLDEFENLEDLIFSKLGYERVSIYSNLSEEKKENF